MVSSSSAPVAGSLKMLLAYCGLATIVLLPNAVEARTWLELVDSKDLTNKDRIRAKRIVVKESNPFFFTQMPTRSPVPSDVPSDAPSFEPTINPTASPSEAPTKTPTTSPTEAPTTEFYIREPKDPDKGYFNYDPDSKYGPGKWDDLKDSWVEESDEARYWDDFSKFIRPSLNNNKCDSGSKHQSPIDVNMDDVRAECLQYHEFRHKPGDYRLGEDSAIKVKIMPSKLRLEYPSDIGVYDADKRSFGGHPAADVPKAWGDQLPVTHVDFKVPSEHWIEGKQYAAEYQIWQIQNRPDTRRGAPAMAILIDDEDDKFNPHLQRALDAFQDIFDADMADCEDYKRKQRRLDAIISRKVQSWLGYDTSDEHLDIVHGAKSEDLGFSDILDEPPEIEAEFQALRGKLNARRTEEFRRVWDPWHTDLYRTIWFYGYEGSLTEPPCTEFVEWHVMDKPAKMSKAQHYQMKKLLFHHVDGKCRKTSVGHNGSVARPIQKMRDRELYKCSCDNFLSDYQVIEEGRKNCGMVPGQKKDVAKSMDKNGKDNKPWTVKDDNWPGNGSDVKGYCGKCELTSKDRKWEEKND